MEIQTPKGKVSKMQVCRHCGEPKINTVGLCHECNRTVTFVSLQKTKAKKDGVSLMERVQERKERLTLELEMYKSIEEAIEDNGGDYIGKPRGFMKHFVEKY